MNHRKLIGLIIVIAVLLSACATPATPAAQPAAPQPTQPPAVQPTSPPTPAPTPVPEVTSTSPPAAAPVELRFMYYADGKEAEVMQPLINKFNQANQDITVILDVVPYQTIDEQLPVQATAGQAPDMARITNFGAFRGLLLDLRPYLKDAAYYESNFPAPVLAAMRPQNVTSGLYGFPDALTVTGPFVNKTLFDQAEVELPGPGATWEDWKDATAKVKEATGVSYALTIDRTGHRLASPVLSNGATLLNSDNLFTVDTEGFRDFVETLKNWHDEGLAPKEVWLASENRSCIDDFKSANLVFCLSGSWQINGLAADVGDNFDWVVVPTPSGSGGSVGIAGGSAVVAFANTDHPAEVARFMEFLIQEENYAEFSAGTLSLPAQSAVASKGVQFKSDNPHVAEALSGFTAGIPNISDQGWALNVHPHAFAYYRNAATRVSQYISGELTLDETFIRLQKDIDDAIAGTGG
jgi:alpha-1,4-digalacturonate transport system substrate-binding protein